jgi:preprotein translocase subunit YajC
MNSGGLIPLQAQPGGVDFAFFMMMGAIFLIFYVLVIRPQQKVTAGGIHGRVSGVDGEVLEVEIAKLRGGDKVKVRVALNRVEQLTKAGQAGSAEKGGES